MREGLKMEWIIFKEFTRRCNTPPPFAENNYFFPKKFFEDFFGLKWSTCCETDSVEYGKFICFFFTPSLRWECRIIVAEVFWISYLPRMTNSKAHFYIEKLAMTGLFWLETGIISPAFLRSWPWRLSWEFVWFLV